MMKTKPVRFAPDCNAPASSLRKSEGNIISLKAINAPTIEHNIPMPHGQIGGILATVRETLKLMKIGDSFVWPDNKALYDAAKQTKIKITTRKINGEGYRVWRVE